MEMTAQHFSHWGFPERVGVWTVERDSRRRSPVSAGHCCTPMVNFSGVCDDRLNKGKWAFAVQIWRIGFSLAQWVQCVWRFSLQQDAYTRGMSIPFVDPWERSSISLLGTALMRPGILPFIPLSLQLGTAHSFRYGHSGVFVYTDTM